MAISRLSSSTCVATMAKTRVSAGSTGRASPSAPMSKSPKRPQTGMKPGPVPYRCSQVGGSLLRSIVPILRSRAKSMSVRTQSRPGPDTPPPGSGYSGTSAWKASPKPKSTSTMSASHCSRFSASMSRVQMASWPRRWKTSRVSVRKRPKHASAQPATSTGKSQTLTQSGAAAATPGAPASRQRKRALRKTTDEKKKVDPVSTYTQRGLMPRCAQYDRCL
mmetsp:Transcript_26586/g.78228  ORF Transcript_26586/g.78228 Transcript_26586/m.78228 type:complete len:220 (+) Transcript_26586:1572-2231(+)